MGTLSRLTGLKPELLRAWQRRFGLFEPERTAGGHRMYTADDLRLALFVGELVDSGRSIGELARRGRPELLREARERLPDLDVVGPEALAATARPAVAASLSRAQMTALCDRVVEASVALDPSALRAAIDRAVAGGDVEQFIDGLVKPASIRIGELWQSGECSVAGEHLASSMLRDRLHAFLNDANPPAGRTAPEAVVACLPGDFHENGALIAAVRLAGLGWRVSWLGAATPLADLDKLCRSRRPHAVYVSATLPELFAAARDGLLALARRWSGAFELVIGGQGAPEADADLAAAGARLSRRWAPPELPADNAPPA